MDVEVLVRTVDRINPNSQELTDGLSKRGDVIVVKPAGWGWSDKERTNPEWRIIRVDNITRAQAELFVSRDTPLIPGEIIARFRSIKVDLDSAEIPATDRTRLADDTRTEPVIALVKRDLLAATVAKDPLP